MRVVLDTNVVVSALLFSGSPRRLLRTLCGSPFELWTSRPLLRELAATLSLEKLRVNLARTGVSVDTLVQAYAGQTFVVPDTALQESEFLPDPGDALVIATAVAASAGWLVTGDHHLLDYRATIPCEVLTVKKALDRASRTGGEDSN